MPSLTLKHAQNLVSEAINLAADTGPIAIAVVDAAGGVIASARMDGAGHSALALATRKAATAANFKAPLNRLLEMISKDDTLLRALGTVPELLLLPGATPVFVDGAPVGAVGIAGGHYSADQAITDQIVAA